MKIGDQTTVSTESSSPPATRQAKGLPAAGSRGLRSDVGQAIVEMAFVVPIFLFLFGGVIEIADALNSYITVIDVSRDGARLGSKGLATDTDIKNMVTTEMARVRGTFNSAQDVTITHNPVAGDNSLRVKVCSNHPLIFPGLSGVISNPLRMCASTTMRTIVYQ
jgi:Flp pilus assembly protein TadG